MTTATSFSHQNDAGSRMCNTRYWENLILVVVLVLESKTHLWSSVWLLHSFYVNLYILSLWLFCSPSQSLDYETTSSYSLTVNVTDGTSIVSQPLTISVRDTNDPPVFTNSPYAASVNENEAAGQVYTASATDQDSGKCFGKINTRDLIAYTRRVIG